MKGLKKYAAKAYVGGIALVTIAAFSLNAPAHAQTCTVANWDNSTGTLQAGDPSEDHRRYGGPCSLQVSLDGNMAWVENETDQSGASLNESRYIARFYAFFGGVLAEAGEFVLFEAYDSNGVSLMTLYYDPEAGNLILDADTAEGMTVGTVSNRWHSIELEWNTSNGTVSIDVGTAAGIEGDSETISTTDNIAAVRLGNVDGEASGGVLYIDDFDSRRMTKPGRLLVGDANGDEELSIADLFSVNNELGPAGIFAAGQPDCNEDGAITIADLFCINSLLD